MCRLLSRNFWFPHRVNNCTGLPLLLKKDAVGEYAGLRWIKHEEA
jgi:hypothetical protein